MTGLTPIQGHLSHMHECTDEQDVGISAETAHLQETNHNPAKKEFKERKTTWFLRNQSYLIHYIMLVLTFIN